MKKISVAFFTAILFILCFMSGSFIVQRSDSRKQEGQEQAKSNDDVPIEQAKQQLEEPSIASTTETVREEEGEQAAITEAVTAANSNKVENTCRYIMKYENNHIIVYEADGITIFEETDIDQSHLSEQMLENLREGIPVSDEETLYSLLESFSS